MNCSWRSGYYWPQVYPQTYNVQINFSIKFICLHKLVTINCPIAFTVQGRASKFTKYQPKSSIELPKTIIFISMATLRPQWVLFGDSITQRSFNLGGWGACIADAWQRKVDVINRGYSGFNTKQATYLAPIVFPSSERGRVQLATLFFGANDAALPDRSSSKQHVPLADYKDNLRRMIGYLRQNLSINYVVLITPPPISERHRFIHVEKTYGVKLAKPERTNEAAGRYADAVIALGDELGIPVLNLWKEFQSNQDWSDHLLCDGLHLTPEGNTLVGTLLQQLIEANFPELAPENLALDVPEWSELCEDPENTLKTYVENKKW